MKTALQVLAFVVGIALLAVVLPVLALIGSLAVPAAIGLALLCLLAYAVHEASQKKHREEE